MSSSPSLSDLALPLPYETRTAVSSLRGVRVPPPVHCFLLYVHISAFRFISRHSKRRITNNETERSQYTVSKYLAGLHSLLLRWSDDETPPACDEARRKTRASWRNAGDHWPPDPQTLRQAPRRTAGSWAQLTETAENRTSEERELLHFLPMGMGRKRKTSEPINRLVWSERLSRVCKSANDQWREITQCTHLNENA